MTKLIIVQTSMPWPSDTEIRNAAEEMLANGEGADEEGCPQGVLHWTWVAALVWLVAGAVIATSVNG